jgi:L-alanine-DL-glutamate epimerase-like enolase superfamily enzyme
VRDTDITVRESTVHFRPITLAPPLVISGRTITQFTMVYVNLSVVNRAGRTATGVGTTILSVPWAWPHSGDSVAERDAVLRQICISLADAVSDRPPLDPFQLWRELSDRTRLDEVPRLAALLCLGAVDNAVHDSWARAAGNSAYDMYSAEYLNHDLGVLLDPALIGRYPAEFLGPFRAELPVQHLVGSGDPLTKADCGRSLMDWSAAEGIRHFKVKVLGRDPAEDADRVGAVHAAVPEADSLAIDPNEAYESAESVAESVRILRAKYPRAAEAVRYIEQPIPRGRPFEPDRDCGIPVLMDEGMSSLETLRGLPKTQWDGLVIKAGKGQTHALLANSFARFHDLFVTVQDLTAVDLAFRHSARLVSMLRPSAHHVEYNSRQYAPGANAELSRTDPQLTAVHNGFVRIDRPGVGIY